MSLGRFALFLVRSSTAPYALWEGGSAGISEAPLWLMPECMAPYIANYSTVSHREDA